MECSYCPASVISTTGSTLASVAMFHWTHNHFRGKTYLDGERKKIVAILYEIQYILNSHVFTSKVTLKFIIQKRLSGALILIAWLLLVPFIF